MHAVSTLTAGLRLGESPRWNAGALWFADWMDGTIATADQPGLVRRRFEVASFPISFDWLADGSLVVVSGGTGLLLISDGGDELMTFADLRGALPPPVERDRRAPERQHLRQWDRLRLQRSATTVRADRTREAGRHDGKRRLRPCLSQRDADQPQRGHACGGRVPRRPPVLLRHSR